MAPSKGRKTKGTTPKSKKTERYRHAEATNLMRPEVGTKAATYILATPDLMMGDLLKNMRSSQIFSVCSQPKITNHRTKDKKYQVELFGLDVFDPITMEVDHRSGLNSMVSTSTSWSYFTFMMPSNTMCSSVPVEESGGEARHHPRLWQGRQHRWTRNPERLEADGKSPDIGICRCLVKLSRDDSALQRYSWDSEPGSPTILFAGNPFPY